MNRFVIKFVNMTSKCMNECVRKRMDERAITGRNVDNKHFFRWYTGQWIQEFILKHGRRCSNAFILFFCRLYRLRLVGASDHPLRHFDSALRLETQLEPCHFTISESTEQNPKSNFFFRQPVQFRRKYPLQSWALRAGLGSSCMVRSWRQQAMSKR